MTGVQTCALPIYIGSDGSTFYERAALQGYNIVDEELIAFGFPDANQIFNLWISSQTHLDIIMDKIGRASCRERV